VIGIAGGTGSGKTCVADILRQRYQESGVAVLNQDSYYLDRSGLDEEERWSLNYDQPSAIDHDLLLKHLNQLVNGSAVARPCYCSITHTRRAEVKLLLPGSIILVEGLFVLRDARLRSRMDLKVYVEADPGLRFIRRLRRDVLERGQTLESVIRQYQDSVRPMHQVFIAATKAHANFVINNSGSLENLPTLLEGVMAEIVRLAMPPVGAANNHAPDGLAQERSPSTCRALLSR
jgi:uridine kinase